MARNISVLSFNILAACWSHPDGYLPTVINPGIFNRQTRQYAILRFLQKRALKTDVISLQEVTETDFEAIKDALPEFECLMSHNDPSYWSNWITPEFPWEPNGCALLLKKSVFKNINMKETPLHTEGNFSVEGSATHKLSNQKMRFWAVHLDSDSNVTRRKEFKDIFIKTPANPNIIDFVIGDLNFDPEYNPLNTIMINNGFKIPLAELGELKPTHPFLKPKYYLDPKWGVISHVLTRGDIDAVSGNPISKGLWSIKQEALRIEANLAIFGTDHFPLKMSLMF